MSEWIKVRLVNLVDRLTNGYVGPTRELYQENGIPYLLARHVKSNCLTFDNKTFVSEEFNQKNKKSILKTGDVLLVQSGHIGASAVVSSEHEGHNCHAMIVISPKANKLDGKFLSWYFGSQNAQREFRRIQTGITIEHLNCRHVKELEIPLPPIAEQKRIAGILDKAEELRGLRRKALEELDAIAQSIFLEMFGDPVYNQRDLPIVTLSEVSHRVTDGTHQPPKWATAGIPFLFVSNIVDGKIVFETHKFISEETHHELTKRCPIELGDVLYTTVGSYGNAALVSTTKKFAFQRHIAHIKPNISRVNPTFLAAMLQSSGVRKQVDKVARGVAQKTVNLADLKKLIIFQPPLPLQQEFARRIEAIEQLKVTHRESLAQLDALFASLQHRAFRGEL